MNTKTPQNFILPEGDISCWFSSDPRPANDPANNTFYLEANLGLTQNLIICIKPANRLRWAYDLERMQAK